MKSINLHIHSFSLRFQFQYRDDFDVFSFIEFARDAGFQGVNISANGPGYRHLGGTSQDHFSAVRAKLEALQMDCELDTSDTRVDNLNKLLDVAAAIGADRLRVYTRYQGTLEDLIKWTVTDLRTVASKAANLSITIVLENHEDFQGEALANIIKQVDHPNIQALYDYGNSQMVGEDPMVALDAMLPYIKTVHIKEHAVIEHNGRIWIQGLPFGEGFLPIIEQTDLIYDSGLRRFCFENVWGYVAPLIDGYRLPDGPSFNREHQHRYLNANELEPAAALNGEMMAFQQSWNWFQQALKQAQYRWPHSQGSSD